jgi:ribosomal protein S18 acetylase RimI-like enzyme
LTQAAYLRLRKDLSQVTAAPEWPPGIRPAAFDTIDPRPVHALLLEAFPDGIGSFDDWYGNLTSDSEFAPSLCLAAMADNGEIAGFVQCWTSDFIKDLAVSPAYRTLGVGTTLMREMFARFAQRGAKFVDLKVGTDNHAARRLYARLGMVEVSG